jgi:hypothetical protein
MLSYLLRSSELSALTAFVSPQFFKVVPMGELLSIARTLTENARNSERWQAVARSANISVSTGSGEKRLHPDHGAEILELYFLQLFKSATWILDFRASAFAVAGTSVHWQPKPFYWEASEDFRRGILSLYAGFYEDRPEEFKEALRILKLSPAEAAFREHFGLGDQRAVRFELASFQKTFAEVFQACATAEARIPGEFAVLGILLLTLYECLEGLGGLYDVRGAYERAKARASQP